MAPYEQGSRAALMSVGIVKTAETLYEGPDGRKLPFWDSVKAHTARNLIGNPSEYWKDIQAGKAFSPGTYSRNMLWPSGGLPRNASFLSRASANLMPMLMYAPSALQLAGAVTGPSEQRGSSIGSALGGLAGTAAGMPLGILGSAGLGMLGSYLGQSAGSLFDKKPPERDFSYDPART